MEKIPQEILDEFSIPEEEEEVSFKPQRVEPVGLSKPIKESREEKARRLHGVNYDANWGDDSTLQNCAFCNDRFDSAKMPYRPTLCYRCFGLVKLQNGGVKFVAQNAAECWKNWMRERFFEIVAYEKNHERKAKTESLVKMIARVSSSPSVKRDQVLDAIDRVYMTGEHKAFFEQWRVQMRKGISEIAVVSAPVETQAQMKLNLFGRN